MEQIKNSAIDMKILLCSLKNAVLLFAPKSQVKNPVMFIAYLGAIATSFYVVQETFSHSISWFNVQIALWLWFTVFFANFSQALVESRGKAQADSLRNMQVGAFARQILNGKEVKVPASQLHKEDRVVCETGDIIPADGDVIEGIATVDESAITGESAPVIRESGGDRSAVTAGTKVMSDRIVIQVTSEPGQSFLDKMINLIEGASRQRTPNEIALNIVLTTLTLIFVLTVTSLKMFSHYSGKVAGQDLSQIVTIPVLIALLVCLIPTTIGALLNAIGIAGMNRLVKRNVIAKSGHSVEAAGDIDLLILDKTGTVTLGSRMAVAFIPIGDEKEIELAKLAQLASAADETPEGRSIMILAKNQYGLRAESLDTNQYKFVPFTAHTRMSGVDYLSSKEEGARSIRKGSADAIVKYIEGQGGIIPSTLHEMIDPIAKSGGTPLLVSDNKRIVGLIHLKDIVKGGLKERFLQMRKMGIKTVMVTGDNPLTAAAIAAEAGIDDFIAEATPEMKLERIRQEQAKGLLVAMAGDGTNDAPALAQADVGLAMNTGTQASREAGNMVDLDSNPTKLIEIVELGKQLLMTRGALTTFSIANDVAKYFAIIPAIFGALYMKPGDAFGPLSVLNVMKLESPQSAILSAVIFNALIIISLIPLSLRGVRYRAQSANLLLSRNILIYGVGGIIAPFIGIKAIDVGIVFLRLV